MWGHEFRDSYLNLSELRRNFSNVPLLMLTATASKVTRDDIISILGATNTKLILSPMDRENIFYEVRKKKADSVDELAALIKDEGSSLVFCSTRKECEELSPKVEARGIKSKCYHGGMEDGIRKRRQTLWMNNDLQCLVCTCAFGMGIDKRHVRLVVHYVIPQSMEDFYQESGRAGRDGQTSQSVIFFFPHNHVFHVRNIFGKMNVNPTYGSQRLVSFRSSCIIAFRKVNVGGSYCWNILMNSLFVKVIVTYVQVERSMLQRISWSLREMQSHACREFQIALGRLNIH